MGRAAIEINTDPAAVVADYSTIEPVRCPCGWARRAFADVPTAPASVHRVEVEVDVMVPISLRSRMMQSTRLRLAAPALLLTMASAAWAGEFHDLFDGKSLDGWVVEGPAKDKTGQMMWSVTDGRIACLGEGFGFLRYDRREFGDFTLRVEYRFIPAPGGKPQANSGLGIRTGRFDPKRSRETRPSYAAFEVQLLDDAGSPTSAHGTGSLYRYRSPTANPARPGPDWNTIEVTCAGPSITIRLNDQTILEADQSQLADVKSKPAAVAAPKDKPRKGYVALQSHSGRVEFRKVQIREAPETTTTRAPSAGRHQGSVGSVAESLAPTTRARKCS